MKYDKRVFELLNKYTKSKNCLFKVSVVGNEFENKIYLCDMNDKRLSINCLIKQMSQDINLKSIITDEELKCICQQTRNPLKNQLLNKRE